MQKKTLHCVIMWMIMGANDPCRTFSEKSFPGQHFRCR